MGCRGLGFRGLGLGLGPEFRVSGSGVSSSGTSWTL